MKKYVADGTVTGVRAVEPGRPRLPRRLRGGQLASKKITDAPGQSFTAGQLGKFTVGADARSCSARPYVFTKANIAKFNF